jgi:hypothetical protein
MIAVGFAGMLSVGLFAASQVSAFPTNATTMKAAAPLGITDVRAGFRGGGGRVAGGAYRGGAYRGGAYGYRGGYYGGGYRPWAGAAVGAAAGAAAVGAAAAGSYYGQQCGYYPYPPC